MDLHVEGTGPSSFEADDEAEKEIESPVAQEEVGANVALQIARVELTQSLNDVIVGFSNHFFSSTDEDHEVGHVVAPADDRVS